MSGVGRITESWGPEARAAALAARKRLHPDWRWGGRTASPLPDGGDCYKAAGQEILSHPDGRVVHGTVTPVLGPLAGHPFQHAWVEDGDQVIDTSNGRRILMARDAYYALGRIKPSEVTRYTRDEALRKQSEDGTWGPYERDRLA